MVSRAVKNTPMERMDRRGAALASDTGFLKSRDRIGPDSTDIPIAQGMEIMEENFRQECMVFMALAFRAIRSSSVGAFLMAAKDAVRAGVKEDAIG